MARITITRRWRTALSISLTLSLVASLLATMSLGTALAASVTPTVIPGASNTDKTCEVQFPGTVELKVEPVPDGTYTRTDGTLTVSIVKPSSIAGSVNSFDWTATGGDVLGVIVKNGVDGANRYDYGPDGSTGDTYLTTPFDGDKGISHISFCYEPGDPFVPEGILGIEKFADGTYDRVITWDLTKSVNPSALSGTAGEIFDPVTWTVTATRTMSEENLLVSGDIEVSWAGNFDLTVDVSDSLPGAVVDCGAGSSVVTLEEPGDLVVCSYTVVPDTQVAQNTATATPISGVGPDGPIAADDLPPIVTATADITWTETVVGYASGTLSDPRFDFAEIIDADTVETFDEVFACSQDAADYTNGSYRYTETNTAFLNGNIQLEASATVDVECTLPALVVTKTAEGSYDRTVEWELDKTVEPARHTGVAGELAGSSVWTVTATKSEATDNFLVTGTITVTNPSGIAQSFTLADVLDDGTVAEVSCPSFTVPAGGTVVCSYEAEPDDDSAEQNTATLTAAGNEPVIATAPVSFTENLIGADEGTLSDPRVGFSELIGASTTVTFTEDFVCSGDAADYTNGEYRRTELNTAFLNDAIDLEASASVEVLCTLPALQVAKTAAGTYDRTVDWELDKTVDIARHVGLPGDTFSSLWTVTATKSEATDNFQVTGTITVTNPAAIAQSFGLVDVLDDGTLAAVTCPSLTVPAGGEVICTYVAVPDDDSVELNTVTLTADGNAPVVATASVAFTENLIGFDEAALSDPRFDYAATITASTVVDFPETFECSTDREDYGEDFRYTERFVNVALLNGNLNLEAEAFVDIDCLWGIGETATGEGPGWRQVVSRSPNNWFMISLTDELLDEGGVRLIAGQHYHIGQVRLVDGYLEFSLDGAYLDAVGDNVKIQPLDRAPNQYLPPGRYQIKRSFDTSLTEFSVFVGEPTRYGYAIHLDVRRSPLLEPYGWQGSGSLTLR